jgi:type I restriction enzyme S subunit
MSLPRYPKYKDSGVEWLGEVPEGWEVKRLKRACRVFPSNVDKKSYEGETPVVLCNYTDVYYNESIRAGMNFMEATASLEQIEKFTLRAGDTIITKDSETADDIAVAAHVPEDLPGVICGYHLSMIRPLDSTNGAFVKRLFDSTYAKSCFAVRANGLTRVGLGQYALDNVELPFPPPQEQMNIAEFLDRETAKIDELVAEQRRLMELLKEKRQAVISHAVTQGLNPDAPMKPSGIEWLGAVPKHWTLKLLKFDLDLVTSGSRGWAQYFSDDGDLFFRITNIQRAHLEPDLSEPQYVTPPAGAEGERSRIRIGDILISITADLGSVTVAPDTLVGAFVSQHVCLARPSASLCPRWAGYALKADCSKVQFEASGYGGTKIQLSLGDVRNIQVALPPMPEQEAIAAYLDDEIGRFDTLTAEAQHAIDLFQERRAALISTAVTGQIDVRNIH